ncbi:MAG: class I SAM-dependent methyltransferase [Flavobacteriaceae bacterium]
MKVYLKTKDYTLTQESFELLHDPVLDMLITEPQPGNLGKYYESEDYISHTDARKSLVDKMYYTVKRYNLKRKLSLIASYTSDKRLLDVGAGTGDFLAMAKKYGWEVTGLEPNELARLKAGEKGIQLLEGLDAVPTGLKFEVITLWHVLEHIPDLEAQISKLVELLTENGVLVVAVPNFKSYDAKHYKEYWAAYDVPRHLWHFSKKSIQGIFAKQGMKLLKSKPMIFDAFYVALLSEKYKNGKQNFIRAFWIGLMSNIRAMDSKEYSSLIYVLKRVE